MKKTLYIHIGTGKTGTTALQDFFLLNKSILKKEGLHYCDTGLIKNNHHLLCRNFQRDNAVIQNQITRNLKKLNDEINITKCEKFLISSEYFPSLTLNEIIEFKKKINISIIPVVYLRRQDEFIESWYAQIVKAYNVKSDIYNLIKRLEKDNILNYSHLTDNWAEINTKNKVIVRAYEKESFHSGNIFDDFMKSIDCSQSSHFPLDRPKKDPNPSIRPNQIKLGLSLYNYCNEDQRKFLFLHYSKLKDDSRFFLNQKERQEIINKHQKTNNHVANKFLNKKQLFTSNLAKPSEVYREYDFLENFLLSLFLNHPSELKKIEEPIIKHLTSRAQIVSHDFFVAKNLLKLALIIRPQGPHIKHLMKELIEES